jgi:hypothetical protein
MLGMANLHVDIRDELEKYLIGILEQITKIQHTFPFSISGILK